MSDTTKTTTMAITLNQQIANLGKMLNTIRENLHSGGWTLPNGVLDNLAYIATNLERLSKKVAEHEDERQDLLALADISQVVNSSLELNAVLRIVMDTIVRLTGAERGFLMLRNEQGEMETVMARNWEQESIHPSEFAVSQTIIDRVLNENKSVLTTNAQEDPRFGGQASIIAYSLRSILCVPLRVKDVTTGVIYADNRIREGLFTEAERNLLNAFANQAAVAIENARLFESVRRTLEEVTELKNLMDNVFASIASGVITADIENKINLFNQAAERILGWKKDQVIGARLEEVLTPLANDLSTHITKARQAEQHVIGQEYRITLPERGEVDLIFNISPLKDGTHTTQGVAIVVDDLTEKKRLEAQRALFERMVPPAVIDQIDINKIELGGERKEITTLFADLRGFTSFSENLDPVELVTILNQYMSAAADAILAQGGTIDKFLGDGVMAWFNAPIPQPDHTLRAVRAALGIRDAIARLHEQFPPEYHLSFGVGIDFGEAVLGLVGTQKRLDYTAIGDSVNTAKRIQENSAPNQIIISEAAHNLIEHDIFARQLPAMHLKGKRNVVQVYEVIGLR